MRLRWGRLVHALLPALVMCGMALSVFLYSVQAFAQSQDSLWTGQVQCQLTVHSSGYTHQEAQTWKLTGAPPTLSGAIQVYPATWSSAGQGTVQQPIRTAQWTVDVQPMNAPLGIFIRASDNRLVIKGYHSQLYSPSGVTGTQLMPTPGTVQFATTEWTLPVIEDSPTSTSVSGSGTVVVGGTSLPLQPGATNTIANCTWQFSKGATAVLSATASVKPLGGAVSMAAPTGSTQLTGGTTTGPSGPTPNAFTVTSQADPTAPGHAYFSTVSTNNQLSTTGETKVGSLALSPGLYAFFVTVSFFGTQGGVSNYLVVCSLYVTVPIGKYRVGSGSFMMNSTPLTITAASTWDVTGVELDCIATQSGIQASPRMLAMKVGAVTEITY